MHRTLKDRIRQSPRATLRTQQRMFNSFRAEFNHVRPHQSLGQKPPVSMLKPYTLDALVARIGTPHGFLSLAPPGTVLAALDIIESEPERRDRLWENTRFMMTSLRAMGFDCGNSQTPVIPIVVGPDHLAFQMAARLDDEGVFVNAVVSPGSPPGRALIRTSYMATHTKAHLTRALEAFHKVGRELGLVS